MVGNGKRIRALDVLDDATKGEWLVYNPLFFKYIPEFDESFNRGVHLNLDYYVPRNSLDLSYEMGLCEYLFSPDKKSNTKVYNLKGNVGSGKTTLCKYIVERILPENESLGIYLDVWPSEEISDNSILKKVFISEVYNALIRNKIVENYKEFCEGVLKVMGWSNLSPKDILECSTSFEPEYVLQYLSLLPSIKNILIIIDNIDESSVNMIENCNVFSLELARICRSLEKNFSILVPAREYTITRYFFQDHFAKKSLKNIDEINIIVKKLEQASLSIKESVREYSQKVEYSPVKGPYNYPNIRIIIKKESAIDFLKEMSKVILSKDENTFYYLVKAISNKNLKIFTGNVYNLIHSCKLPLTKLFNKVFLTNINFAESTDAITFNLAVECLMSIHYPFYDVNSSHIVNIFNLNNSKAPNDFKNTLTIPRLICFLRNKGTGTTKLSEIYDWFGKYMYTKNLIDDAIEKCFNYGLVISNHGCHSRILENNSILSSTSISNFYLDILICNYLYLSFISDDTPMSPNLYSEIHKKYDKDLSKDNHKFTATVSKSAKNFIQFLEHEEALEREFLEKNHLNYNDFHSQTCLSIDNNYLSFSKHITEKNNYVPKSHEIKKYFQ